MVLFWLPWITSQLWVPDSFNPSMGPMGYKDRPMLPEKNRCQGLTYIHVTGRIHLGHFFVDPLHWKPMVGYLDFWEQIKFSLMLYDWLDCHIIDQTICYLSNFSGSSALYKSGFCSLCGRFGFGLKGWSRWMPKLQDFPSWNNLRISAKHRSEN